MCKSYEVINSRIIELLESGCVPWRRTWDVKNAVPRSLVTMKPYAGINVFLLGCQQYRSSYSVTFKAAKERGGWHR